MAQLEGEQDPAVLREQIEIRQRILPTLVGWLYPLVVAYEIDKLRERLKKETP